MNCARRRSHYSMTNRHAKRLFLIDRNIVWAGFGLLWLPQGDKYYLRRI